MKYIPREGDVIRLRAQPHHLGGQPSPQSATVRYVWYLKDRSYGMLTDRPIQGTTILNSEDVELVQRP